jgi:hypothetical protein
MSTKSTLKHHWDKADQTGFHLYRRTQLATDPGPRA